MCKWIKQQVGLTSYQKKKNIFGHHKKGGTLYDLLYIHSNDGHLLFIKTGNFTHLFCAAFDIVTAIYTSLSGIRILTITLLGNGERLMKVVLV